MHDVIIEKKNQLGSNLEGTIAPEEALIQKHV